LPSRALAEWDTDAQEAMGELIHAHEAVGGTAPGRRRLTQQLNYAYVALLAARFQGFCRALHSEVAGVVALGAADPGLRLVVEASLTRGRKLDGGTARPANLGSDFNRFGFEFWDAVRARDQRNRGRQEKLEQLVEWRNGIVHDDIGQRRQQGKLEPDRMNRGTCRNWHGALDNLAVSFDEVVADQCENLGRPRPW
jgi:hypothetical protein